MDIKFTDAGPYIEHTHEEVVMILGWVNQGDWVNKLANLVSDALQNNETLRPLAPAIGQAIKWIFGSQTNRILAADKGNGITMLMPWHWLALGWFWFFEIHTRPATPAPIVEQDKWRHCNRCKGLFFGGESATAGVCPTGGPHDTTVSGNYTLTHNVPTDPGQHDWRYCMKCAGLFFSAGQELFGVCPAGGMHGHRSLSGDYSLPHDSPTAPGQSDWRWCHKCYGLFFANQSDTAGQCPAGGVHEKSYSGNYTLRHVG